MIGEGCFPAGALVATPSGPWPIEALRPGAEVLTALGPRTLAAIEPEAPPEGAPGAAIRLHPHALGPDAPDAPLMVATEQLLLVAGARPEERALVPAASLANGGAIARTARPPGLVWYRLVFDGHALPLIARLACASARAPGADLAAPLLAPGPALLALRARLASASPPPPRIAPAPVPPAPEATVALEADGCIVAAHEAEPGRWQAVIPPRAAALYLRSPAIQPRGEARRLGVAVQALALDGIPLALAGPVCGEGFHALEGDAPRLWRWTDGRARLCLPPAAIPRRLAVCITDWHTTLEG